MLRFSDLGKLHIITVEDQEDRTYGFFKGCIIRIFLKAPKKKKIGLSSTLALPTKRTRT